MRDFVALTLVQSKIREISIGNCTLMPIADFLGKHGRVIVLSACSSRIARFDVVPFGEFVEQLACPFQVLPVLRGLDPPLEV